MEKEPMIDAIQRALLFSTDNGHYPNIFDLNIGNDFKLETKPEYQFEIRQPRTVVIIIDSFIGYCGGAKHYYARIEADGIDIIEIVTDNEGKQHKYHVCGYICEEFKKMPREKRDLWESKYRIEIDTIVTESMKKDDSITWEGYDIGDKTNRFTNKQDAIDTSKMVASVRFPGWQILLNDTTL